jgi:hypothetical protein
MLSSILRAELLARRDASTVCQKQYVLTWSAMNRKHFKAIMDHIGRLSQRSYTLGSQT